MKYYHFVNSGIGKFLINPKTWKKYEFKYIKKAEHVIVITQAAKTYYSEVLNINPDKISVVSNSVGEDFYKNHAIDKSIEKKLNTKSFNLLYLGDTSYRRGLETAIKALKFLIPQIPEIKLIIVGKSKSDPQLKAIVAENNWQKHVAFEGFQDIKLFPSYIHFSHIGICPLHRNIHHDTTYANKIFQYLSFGKPIIVSDSTAQAEIAIKYHCGLVFEDRNIEEFVNATLKLYKNKDLYSTMSINAINAIKTDLNQKVLLAPLLKIYSTHEKH